MKGPTSFGQILVAAIAFSSTTSAWPGWLPAIDSLVVRQDDSSSTATATTTTKASATTTAKTSIKTTNLNTGGQTQTATGTGTDVATTTGKTTNGATHTSYDAVDGAGGITMLTPSTASPLYKISDTITWVWNYTSLQGTPTAIDIYASCSTATQTVTLTQNMTFEPTGSFVWDTNAYQASAVQNQLLTAQYTMVLYDSDSSVSAPAEAGYLSVQNSFHFGLYAKRPYQNLSEWNCATCSAGNGDLDRKALGFAVSMAAITVLSFTWFVAGFGAVL